jgi:hypothetical protein
MEYATPVNRPMAHSFTPSATLWLRLAVLYLIVGVGLGIAMGSTANFTLRPVHAHLNLLGWTTMALAGLIYSVYPDAGASRLARIHFWLHNIALPAMMGSLAVFLSGKPGAVPILVTSEIVAAAGVIVFACNIFLNADAAARPRGSGITTPRAAAP